MNGFVGGRVHMPHVTSHGEDSCQFKPNDGEVNEGPIGDGITTNGHNALNLTETFHKDSMGLLGVHRVVMLA